MNNCVGFCVARFMRMGNAKASKHRTGNLHDSCAFSFYINQSSLLWGISERHEGSVLLMKQVIDRPIAHFVPLVDDVDARTLASLPDSEFAEVWQHCMSAEKELVFRVNPDFIVREIGDEWMLVPTGDFAQHFNGMISQNEFSHFVWSQFSEPHSVGEVLQNVHSEFDDDADAMDIEVLHQIEDFARMGLIIRDK